MTDLGTGTSADCAAFSCKAILDEGIAAGAFRSNDSFLIAFDIVSLGHMWALKHHRFKGDMRLEDYTEAQTAHIMRILGAEAP